MTDTVLMAVAPAVTEALRRGHPVVALESTLITHGLPWPTNLETARAAEAAVVAEGAVPATIAVWLGRAVVGMGSEELAALAEDRRTAKASRRDLAAVIAAGRSAGTTVAATLFLAHCAGIRVFATGGIGGVHRGAELTFDVSPDLTELGRTPVAVVCAGAKNLLDLPRTLEVLESKSVPVIGFQTDEFPAFFERSSGLRLDCRVDSPEGAAKLLSTHWQLGGAGVVIAQPPPVELAIAAAEFDNALQRAQDEATRERVQGKALTPFLLARIAEHTRGKTLTLNQALVVANARLAARIAVALSSHTP